MPTNHRATVTQALLIGISAFVVLSLWDWVEFGSIRLFINAMAAIAIAVASVIADKFFLKR